MDEVREMLDVDGPKDRRLSRVSDAATHAVPLRITVQWGEFKTCIQNHAERSR